jgi:hypothetical protein
MSHVKQCSVLKHSSGKVVYQRHEMPLSVKFHPMNKSDEIIDCKTSSSLTDLLTKTMNEELRLGFKFCRKMQTTVSLKVSERVIYVY